jgi:phage terminase large subunit GpA-like protein
VREWVKLRERNDALDLEVYALAGLYILGPAFLKSLPERAAQLASPIQPAQAPPRPEGVQFPPALLRRPQSGGWMNSWRRW